MSDETPTLENLVIEKEEEPLDTSHKPRKKKVKKVVKKVASIPKKVIKEVIALPKKVAEKVVEAVAPKAEEEPEPRPLQYWEAGYIAPTDAPEVDEPVPEKSLKPKRGLTEQELRDGITEVPAEEPVYESFGYFPEGTCWLCKRPNKSGGTIDLISGNGVLRLYMCGACQARFRQS